VEATTSLAGPVELPGRTAADAAARVGELFERHGAAVLGLCRVLLRNPHEAEDAVQQTFLSAYRSLLGGTEPRHPAAWLATIARNECWAHIRRRMREPLNEDELESPLPDPVAAAAARADLQALWQAVGELPRRQRQALLLREFSGLTYEELAVVLGVTEPAVESLLFRARRQLRVRLRPAYGSTALVAPLASIRDALSQALGGLPAASTAAGAVPVVAKLAFGAAAVVVAGGSVAAIETHGSRNRVAPRPPAAAAPVIPASDPDLQLPSAPRVRVVRAAPAPAPHRARPAPVVRRVPVEHAAPPRAVVVRSAAPPPAPTPPVPAPVETPAPPPPAVAPVEAPPPPPVTVADDPPADTPTVTTDDGGGTSGAAGPDDGSSSSGPGGGDELAGGSGDGSGGDQVSSDGGSSEVQSTSEVDNSGPGSSDGGGGDHSGHGGSSGDDGGG
jgi:RNA polymerase sigma-70 factor, ECF subfamily